MIRDAVDDKIRLRSALFVLICILVYLGETLLLLPHRPPIHAYLTNCFAESLTGAHAGWE
jgi:hypothetical protein